MLTARKVGRFLLEIVSLLVFLIFIIPLILIVINSAKSSPEILANPISLPENWGQLWTNIVEIWNNPSIRHKESLVSSALITVVSLLSITLTSSLAAWAMVRYKSKMSDLLLLLFVAGMVIPFQVVMYPLISWFKDISDAVTIPLFNFSLLRSYPGIILAYTGFGMGQSLYMFHSFIKSVPVEIEEAAEIDGANKLQTFFYVVMPILKPIYITVILLNGIWIWNDYLLPVMLLGVGNDIQTLPIALNNFAGSYTKQWDMILSSSLLIMLPVIIIFLFAQKHIIKGMVDGAVK